MDYPEMPEGYGPSHIPFQPSQQQDIREQRPAAPRPQQRPAPQQPVKQQAKMPKAQALAIARRMKQGIVVGSLLCFGTVGGLIINQASQAQQATTTSSSQTSSQGSLQSGTSSTNSGTSSTNSGTSSTNSGTSTTNSGTSTTNSGTSSSSSTQSGTTSQQGGGYGFGSTSAAQPVSGSHTS